MHAVAVRRLSLRIPSGHLAASRQRAEDALFLAAPDEIRVMLLRRLDLGRLPARALAGAWTARAETRLAERRARAVHAAQPGAEASDAVWFRSIEEARELLLLLLTGGRQPTAWFWRLAMPEWQSLPLPAVLEDWLAAAVRQPAAEVALARAVVAVTRAGRLASLVAALTAGRLPEMSASTLPISPFRAAAARREAERLSSVLLVRLDPPIWQAVRQAISDLPAGSTEAHWLARLALVAAAPELAGQVATLAVLAEAAVVEVRRVATGAGDRTTSEPPPASATQEQALARLQQTNDDPPPVPGWAAGPEAPPSAMPALPPGVDAPAPARAPSRTAGPAPDPPPAAFLEEQSSRGAGVFLTIRALERLGLGDRLADDPHAAASGFGRHLLCHIAARTRLPPEDPLFALLPAPDPPPDADALRAWRVGLDRWFRRRTRLRLADIASRRGWLHLADTTLLVRFPLDAADLRLRRLALDLDPHWVPWLGLSVRYHFRDAPLA